MVTETSQRPSLALQGRGKESPQMVPTLPNLLIIGARKAGTTSLHEYLALHPQIFMSKTKELSFFDEHNRWRLGIDWYKSNFDAAFPINGESSPQYARYPQTKGVPERIKTVLGSPKLIYAIRDPVERILSDYVQMVQSRGFAPERRSFEEILTTIESESEQYLECSSYFFQLSKYLPLFPRENLHVVVLERLQKDPARELKSVFSFLGVDSNFWSPDYGAIFNAGESKLRTAEWFDRRVPLFLQRQIWQPTWMPWKMADILGRVAFINAPSIPKPKLAKDQDLRLQNLLRADVSKLREFLNDPLTEWRPY